MFLRRGGRGKYSKISTGNTVPLLLKNDAQNRDRSTDLLLDSLALYHLSYSHVTIYENFKNLNIMILILFELDTIIVHH